MKILLTGGMGFIGSSLVRELFYNSNHEILNIDNLSYASNTYSIPKEIKDSDRYSFLKINIVDQNKVEEIFHQFRPDKLVHLAAETHVDNSISSPDIFLQSNVLGTFSLLEASKKYLINKNHSGDFMFHHISTDEVYGDLSIDQNPFTESSPYMPSSPYAASKASSDHLVRSWGRTFGLPFTITNCSNNFGPFQHREKFIPKTILNLISGKKVPIYGSGNQIRDWLFVEDHAKALHILIDNKKKYDTYNIGAKNERTNIEITKLVCSILEDKMVDKPNNIKKYSDLITHVEDRPGHDLRYALDPSRFENEFTWQTDVSFEKSMLHTVEWYLENAKNL